MHISFSRKYGVTGPLSMKESNANDIARTSSLQAFLLSSKIYETDEEAITRERVLGRLNYMFNNFIKIVGKRKGLSESDIKAAIGNIYTFGSYRLGVHAKGADIDTLCVAPVYVERKEFFDEFYQILKKVFAEVTKIEEAYVPLIQLVYRESKTEEHNQTFKLNGRFQSDVMDETTCDEKNGTYNLHSDHKFHKYTENILENTDTSHLASTTDCKTSDERTCTNKRLRTRNNQIEKYRLNGEKTDRDQHCSGKKNNSHAKHQNKIKDSFNVVHKQPPSVNFMHEDINHHNDNTDLNKKIIEIKIDLVFARLNIFKIDSNLNLLDSSLLKNLDEKSVISLNGNRVTDEILSLVPNKKVFHGALRCIKYWASRRGITGHLYGYFGGVAYAISVARICQLFPNMCEYTIVYKYFEIYREWKWPTPILLKNIENFNYNLKVWDPKTNPSDKFHKMPVITPSYPSMCSTHNIINSTMKRYKEELERGYNLLVKGCEWNEFFKNTDFFQRYKSFLAVCIILKKDYLIENVTCDNFSPQNCDNLKKNKTKTINKTYTSAEDIDKHKMWLGHVNSRIRFLSTKLETIEQLDSAPPFPQTFNISSFLTIHPQKDIPNNVHCSITFVALDMADPKQLLRKRIFIDKPIDEFKDIINDWDKKTEEMDIVVRVMKRKDVNLLLKDLHDFEQTRLNN